VFVIALSFNILTELICIHTVRTLQADNESTTLVQVSHIYLGQVSKGKERKKDQFSKLAGFGAGQGRFGRSEVERILYHMILRQYLREVDKTNKMGFTTTFLAVGDDAHKITRGERVRIVCKTRYERRKDPKDQKEPRDSSKKSKKSEKKPAKTSKASRKTTSNRSSTDLIEELSDDFDEDVIEVLPPHTLNRAVPSAKDVGR
jgi:hypothetical protein